MLREVGNGGIGEGLEDAQKAGEDRGAVLHAKLGSKIGRNLQSSLRLRIDEFITGDFIPGAERISVRVYRAHPTFQWRMFH
jgi:hypothetical protein